MCQFQRLNGVDLILCAHQPYKAYYIIAISKHDGVIAWIYTSRCIYNESLVWLQSYKHGRVCVLPMNVKIDYYVTQLSFAKKKCYL